MSLTVIVMKRHDGPQTNIYFILWDTQVEVEFALDNGIGKLPEPH